MDCLQKTFWVGLFLCISLQGLASDPNLVGWWKLDESSGAVASDSSGNGYDGSLQGDPNWVAGKIGNALYLDGMGDYVDCNDVAAFDLADNFTVCAWVLTSYTADHQTILSKAEVPANYALDIVKASEGGGLRFFGYENYTAKGIIAMTGPSIADGTWHHVAGTFDGVHWVLYDNGNVYDTKFQAGSLTPTAESLQIGYRQTDGDFRGLIDDVRIYDRALGYEEIAVLVGRRVLRVTQAYDTIQAAVDDANDLDIIIVADGVYTGPGNWDIDLSGKAITLKSENGPTKCIIDASGVG